MRGALFRSPTLPTRARRRRPPSLQTCLLASLAAIAVAALAAPHWLRARRLDDARAAAVPALVSVDADDGDDAACGPSGHLTLRRRDTFWRHAAPGVPGLADVLLGADGRLYAVFNLKVGHVDGNFTQAGALRALLDTRAHAVHAVS